MHQLADSAILHHLAADAKLLIVGAVYDLDSGKAHFLDDAAAHH